ncbi:MAG: tetratricopeptide repeat protein [Hoeflea sp.]|nr:tetratricopeptide repeat protein [Alphaproteobacteria bacterium]MBV1724109.1 tetratricopeptide repeat protein [Hoeflea sp.]MBU4546445.1 tetratricopeptide repeat protein [Alphaproteobacteria bacterium]MBU4553037.1 tetratricopeptide repeat protein [Alphaproteobacteria bacterium]MBV1759794.1 tetratricopeptide repeat protein [Hoeflea sp.]
MRRNLTARFAASVALGVFLSMSGSAGPLISPAAAAAQEKAPEQETEIQPNFLGFAGAFLAGRTADVDNDTGRAIEFYRKALEFDPENADIKQRLMVALLTDGRFEEGVVLARELKEDPAVAQVSNLALLVEATTKREYRKAASLIKPDDSNPIDNLLNTLLKAWTEYGDSKGSEGIRSILALEGPPWYPVFTRYHAGAMAWAMGNKAEARKHFTDLIADPQGGGAAPDTYIRGVMALAGMEARDGNTRAALDALAKGEDFSPGYAPLAALRQLIDEGGKPEAGVKTAQQGAAAAFFTLGSALNREGAEETVAVYLQFARVLDPADASTLVILGGLKERLGKIEDAIAIYEAVPETSPMRRVSELQLGLALADLERTDEAKEHLKALIAADPKDIRSYLAYGSVLSMNKDYAEMALTYERAISVIGPTPTQNDWNLFFQAGIANERLKQWPKAEAHFKRALELYPDQPQVMNYLGYSWIDMNMNLKEGMDLIRAAVDLRPNDGYIVDSLGWAHYRLGQYEDAVRELERAVELRPADPTINDHLGDAYWRVGRELEATFQWKRALANEPEADLKPKIELKLSEGLPVDDPDIPAAANGAIKAGDTSL